MIASTGIVSADKVFEFTKSELWGMCQPVGMLNFVGVPPTSAAGFAQRPIQYFNPSTHASVGWLGYTFGKMIEVFCTARNLGLNEKRLTFDCLVGEPDDGLALESQDLATICSLTDIKREDFDFADLSHHPIERSNYAFRCSPYFVNDMKQGGVVCHENVCSLWPDYERAETLVS
jgi:sialic acid synthase SpsE